MTNAATSRREFLQSGLMAASLVAAGRLPLLAEETGGGSAIDAKTGPYAVKPIRDYLPSFVPSAADVGESRHALRYDIVHWHWGRQGRDSHENSVVGRVDIRREAAEDHVVYHVTQKTKIGGSDNVIEATITCNNDTLNTVQRWRLKSYELDPKGQVDSISELVEEGSCDNGKIRIEGANYHHGFMAERPIVTQWTLPSLLNRQAAPSLRVQFDLLQDLSLHKPNQQLTYDGKTEVPLANGRSMSLETFAQTGQGILPKHYLVDSVGRVQLITGSFLSWALQS